jgi:hypothetical protein
MLFADAVVAAVYEGLGAEELVITEITGGKHGVGSRHFVGLAIDYRRWTLRLRTHPDLDEVDHAPEAVRLIAHRLRGQFDVVLEKTHIHVEFDPKH